MFISFDGVDGVGKSTQTELFVEWLREQGRTVVTCRDPGSTELGERLRTLVLKASDIKIDAESEMLLYMAARAQLVAEVIQPALAAGQVVVSDRFLLANVVYQGHAAGLDPQSIWDVGNVATAGQQPDLTVVLDMPLERAVGRIGRELDRMEAKGSEFLQRVRQGFLTEAERAPEQIKVINADQEIEQVQADIRQVARECLEVS
ncbi:MAG TPA: dTMP kinase [Planctomycetes bacterium]|jgi:dTMP kinase|nr:dTMP kinase [Planctomycetaceae bacterium]HIN94004.1 dTMP kinase [Planctomycetota bacterium]